MATVTLEDMKSKLVPINDVFAHIGMTEPLHTDHISSESKVKFKLEPDWAEGIQGLKGTDVITGALMSIDGTEREISKEALLQAGSTFGLQAPYMRKVPANLIEGLLNYHYSGGMGDQEFNVLSVGDKVGGFMKPTLVPFSNVNLLERVVEGITARHPDANIYADYKFQHTLQRTDVRLIVPEISRDMVGTAMRDVPSNETDTWLAGIHVSNSLMAKSQTEVDAYLFRWWCTNGATSIHPEVGMWSRKLNGQADDVYQWARESVDEILGGMESQFDQVQALNNLSVAGNASEILREIFVEYGVPVSQRESIMANLLEYENLTMYAIMSAITQAANEADLEDRRRDRLMRIGGAIPTQTFDTLKARIWREGHFADETALNPYEAQLIQV